jgi:hypothetical protein
VKKSAKPMNAMSSGQLKTGPKKDDAWPKGKANPVDKGERAKGKSPMRKGK